MGHGAVSIRRVGVDTPRRCRYTASVSIRCVGGPRRRVRVDGPRPRVVTLRRCRWATAPCRYAVSLRCVGVNGPRRRVDTPRRCRYAASVGHGAACVSMGHDAACIMSMGHGAVSLRRVGVDTLCRCRSIRRVGVDGPQRRVGVEESRHRVSVEGSRAVSLRRVDVDGPGRRVGVEVPQCRAPRWNLRQLVET
ncbi:hypothetical protein EDB85DRAFT_1898034 [Lactarius pseudohatsudake]|nr:hypothetical protein EDB85DRAFT_1898034 [Lactarius pseudohatsudake]